MTGLFNSSFFIRNKISPCHRKFVICCKKYQRLCMSHRIPPLAQASPPLTLKYFLIKFKYS